MSSITETKNVGTTTEQIAKLEYEKAISLRNFEIDLFWKRSWFFGVLLLSIIAGFYTLKISPKPIFAPIFLSFIGLLTAFFQCLMNRGSKYWHERWEFVTMNRESALGLAINKTKMFSKTERYYIDACILAKDENILTQSHRFSVSKLTFLVWDIVCICCLLVWINESIQIFSLKPNWDFTITLIVFYTTIVTYIYIFFKKGKVFEGFMRKELQGKNLKEESENYVQNRTLQILE
ncbi:MAG: hypothetical protein V4556_04630 [Bacteroidota bacterium]